MRHLLALAVLSAFVVPLSHARAAISTTITVADDDDGDYIPPVPNCKKPT